MKIKLVIIIMIVLCSTALFYQTINARVLPPIDVTPQTARIFLPIIPKSGEDATAMDQETSKTAIVTPVPDEDDSDCGQYAEWGGHPCPQNDEANPPAYNHRIGNNKGE